MASDLYKRVHEALGVEVASVRPLSGGCIGEVYHLRLRDGAEIVAKVDGGASACLDTEAFMLQYLAGHSRLPVPRVLHHTPSLLLMEYVPGHSHFDARAETHAAELLAALHGVTAEAFGLDRPTLIGGLHQPNPWTKSWVDFFRDQRLLYMAEEALRAGVMPQGIYKRLVAFAGKLEDFLPEPAQPSLLHGDVWTTNVLAREGRIVAFLDPAVYFGHPEIELAFVALFSTFGQEFFRRYNELRPLPPGFFELRKDIYNLYPLLVHTRLFGASYLRGVEHTLARAGF